MQIKVVTLAVSLPLDAKEKVDALATKQNRPFNNVLASMIYHNFQDAYRGARDEVEVWKDRALQAESALKLSPSQSLAAFREAQGWSRDVMGPYVMYGAELSSFADYIRRLRAAPTAQERK